jgi:hypothetical protein
MGVGVSDSLQNLVCYFRYTVPSAVLYHCSIIALLLLLGYEDASKSS